MKSEKDRIREMMANMAKGKETGRKLKYDRVNKRFGFESASDDPDETIRITPQDTKFYGQGADRSGTVVLSCEEISKLDKRKSTHRTPFVHWPGEDVYSFLGQDTSLPSVPGSISFMNGVSKDRPRRFRPPEGLRKSKNRPEC